VSRKQPVEEPDVDNFEFYLAEDLGELDLEVDPDDATPDRPPSRELRKRIAKSQAAEVAKKAATAKKAKRNTKRTPSLAERGRPPQKKMSAQEALAAIKQAEADKEAAKKQATAKKRQVAEQKKKAKLAKRLARDAALKLEAKRLQDEKRKADEEADWARAAFGSSQGPGTDVAGATPMAAPPRKAPAKVTGASMVIQEIAEKAEILQAYETVPAALVGPLFLSHQLRAQHDGDLATAVAFAAVRDAIEHRPESVSAARVAFGGQEWAVWMDDDRVVAALVPADLYLVGL